MNGSNSPNSLRKAPNPRTNNSPNNIISSETLPTQTEISIITIESPSPRMSPPPLLAPNNNPFINISIPQTSNLIQDERDEFELTQNIREVSNQITKLNSEMNHISIQLFELIGKHEKGKSSEEITTIKTGKIGELNKKINDITQELKIKSQIIQEFYQDWVNATTCKLRTTLEERRSVKILPLKKKISDLQEERKGLENDRNKLSAEKIMLENEMTALTAQVADLKTLLESLQAQTLPSSPKRSQIIEVSTPQRAHVSSLPLSSRIRKTPQSPKNLSPTPLSSPLKKLEDDTSAKEVLYQKKEKISDQRNLTNQITKLEIERDILGKQSPTPQNKKKIKELEKLIYQYRKEIKCSSEKVDSALYEIFSTKPSNPGPESFEQTPMKRALENYKYALIQRENIEEANTEIGYIQGAIMKLFFSSQYIDHCNPTDIIQTTISLHDKIVSHLEELKNLRDDLDDKYMQILSVMDSFSEAVQAFTQDKSLIKTLCQVDFIELIENPTELLDEYFKSSQQVIAKYSLVKNEQDARDALPQNVVIEALFQFTASLRSIGLEIRPEREHEKILPKIILNFINQLEKSLKTFFTNTIHLPQQSEVYETREESLSSRAFPSIKSTSPSQPKEEEWTTISSYTHPEAFKLTSSEDIQDLINQIDIKIEETTALPEEENAEYLQEEINELEKSSEKLVQKFIHLVLNTQGKVTYELKKYAYEYLIKNIIKSYKSYLQDHNIKGGEKWRFLLQKLTEALKDNFSTAPHTNSQYFEILEKLKELKTVQNKLKDFLAGFITSEALMNMTSVIYKFADQLETSLLNWELEFLVKD